MNASRLFAAIVAGTMLSAADLAAQEKGVLSAITKPAADERLAKALDAARSLIADQKWQDAAKNLQAVLDAPSDGFVRVSERDPADPKKEIVTWRGLKSQANEMIASMPAPGRQAYEAAYGLTARATLDIADKNNDLAAIAAVALRYRHTKAGIEAINLLAKAMFDEKVRPDGWPSWRGNASNTGAATARPPILDKKLWSRPTMMDKLEGFDEADPDEPAKKRIDTAIMQVRALKQPVLPGFFPIASNGLLAYRSQRDVRGVALRDIRYKDPDTGEIEETPAGHILWKTIPMFRSLSVLLGTTDLSGRSENPFGGKANAWVDLYEKAPGMNAMLYENTVIGVLSTDGPLVYSIDDLAVPPIPHLFENRGWNPGLNPGPLKPLLMSNELAAYHLINGKLQWSLNERDALFKDSHFLGAPLCLGGKLYVLNERILGVNKEIPFGTESELRLVCIDPKKVHDGKPLIVGPMVVLGKVAPPGRFVRDIRRRLNAASPAFADNMLVCPTNAGTVFGVDWPTRSLAWAYDYRESAPEPLDLPGLPLPNGVKGTTVISNGSRPRPCSPTAKSSSPPPMLTPFIA